MSTSLFLPHIHFIEYSVNQLCGQGFMQKIVHTFFTRLLFYPGICITCDHDDLDLLISSSDMTDEVYTEPIRKAIVEEYDRGLHVGEIFLRFGEGLNS